MKVDEWPDVSAVGLLEKTYYGFMSLGVKLPK